MPATTKNFFEDIAPFTKALMLKNIAGRIRPLVRNSCRLGFDPLEQG